MGCNSKDLGLVYQLIQSNPFGFTVIDNDLPDKDVLYQIFRLWLVG